MKKYYFLTGLMALMGLSMSAQEVTTTTIAVSEPDTVLTVEKPESIVITETGNSTQVIIKSAGEDGPSVYTYSTTIDDADDEQKKSYDFELPFERQVGGLGTPHTVFKGTCLQDIYYGALIPLDTHDAVKTFMEGGVMSIVKGTIAPWRRGPSLSVGFGMGWKTIVVSDEMTLEKQGETLQMVPLPEGAVQGRAHLHMYHFTIPVMLKQHIYKYLDISAGVVMNLNTYCTASSDYTIGNTDYHTTYKGLHQRFFSYDIMAKVGIAEGTSIYVKYSPQSWFEGHGSPHFKTISAGIILDF